MAHDQLFKELLQAFLREFMELFFPDIAARLDWEQVTFPNTELFTDVPEGSVRRADTVALVPTLDGDPELVLINVETQSERRSEVRFRVFEYYMLLCTALQTARISHRALHRAGDGRHHA